MDFSQNVSSSVIKILVNDENIKIKFDNDINLNDQKELQVKKYSGSLFLLLPGHGQLVYYLFVLKIRSLWMPGHLQ